jgi:hypothetical protein
MGQLKVARQFWSGVIFLAHFHRRFERKILIAETAENAESLGIERIGLSQFLTAFSAISAVQALGGMLHSMLTAYPTANVMQLPITTHHVKGTCDQRQRYSAVAKPQIMPAIAPA